MPIIETVRCQWCHKSAKRGQSNDPFRYIEHHEERCESRPTDGDADSLCRCGKAKNARLGGFIHGDLEPSSWPIHQGGTPDFPDRSIGQHRFTPAPPDATEEEDAHA